MPLGAEDVQTTEVDYFLMFCFDDSLRAFVRDAPLLVSNVIGIDLVAFQKLARHEIRISAEQNVGTAAGHVRCNRD